MATRIDKKIGAGFLNLENHLKRRAGRKFEGANYEGLLRKNALSDLTDSSVALTNVFNSLTKVSDQSEIKLYGEYSVNDWEVTGDFVSNQITKQFLQPLKNASSVGGILGSTVSTSPRIRIEDRINLIDSFYNRGSWPGLGSGCTAFFYGVPPGAVKELGFVKFQIGTDSSLSNITFYTDEGGTSTTTLAALCGEESSIVVDIISYKNPSTLENISLAGAGISLKLIKSSSSTTVFNSSTANLLKSIKQILTAEAFANVKFKIGRPYSIKNPPRWYSELPPTDANTTTSADDTNPATSFMVLDSSLGEFIPYSEKEYWFSGNYVETRWSGEERSFLGGGAGIVQDSNIRFSSPPRVLRDFNNNWGVRWDGYLVVYDSDINKYSFNIQTNSAIKIDICSEVDGNGGSGAPRWNKVFDSLDPSYSVVDQAVADTYYTKNTFVLNNLHVKFKHFLDVERTKWIAYVPISIRFYAPAADKAYPAISIPSEPNFFIKLLSSTPAGSAEVFHSGEIEVTVAASGTDWIITPSPQQTPNLSSILGLSASRANYSLIKKQTSVTRITETGAEETVLLFTQLSSPIQLTLLLDNTTIKATSTATITAGTFKLRIQPRVEGYLSSPFWKSSFISPSLSHKKYQDLIDGSFEPSIYKLSYSSKPQWWKVSEGYRYDVDFPVSKSNTPLDGFIKNNFKSQLSSNALGVGKYGNGVTPPVYSSRPNIILGEGAYPSSEALGENYIGIRLMPNLLGEGGKIKFTGIPLNNSESNNLNKLGANDLGGATLSKTAASGSKLVHRVVLLYHHLNPGGVGERYLLHQDITTPPTVSDSPTAIGLEEFTSASFWAAPVTVTATLSADNAGLTINPRTFVGPLVLNVEKIIIGGVNLLAFSTSLKSILNGGSDKSDFSGKYIKIYNELYGSFQFTDVDTGESISYSDVLKLSYSANTPIPSTSEVPKPPADRVTPFGYDDPKYTSGVCYPPYTIGDSLLSSITATDTELPSKPPGNYDVFWGDHTLTADLGQKFLEITEKIEFSHNSNEPQTNIIQQLIISKSLSDQDYTHRMKIEFPLPAGYNEDVFEHIGNQEKVKDVYYLFINAKSGTGFLPGL